MAITIWYSLFTVLEQYKLYSHTEDAPIPIKVKSLNIKLLAYHESHTYLSSVYSTIVFDVGPQKVEGNKSPILSIFRVM